MPRPRRSLPRLAEMLVPMGFAGARPLGDHEVAHAAVLTGAGAWRLEHAPRDHWLLFTERGTSTLDVGGRRHALRSGDLWLVPAGIPLRWTGGRGPWRGFRLALRPGGRWVHLQEFPARRVEAGQSARMMACLEGICFEAAGPHYPDHAAMGGYFAGAIVLYLDRRLGIIAARGQPRRSASLHDLWARVATRLGERWTVPVLARTLGVSAAQLHRLCREAYRATPHAVLTRLRMEAARSHVVEGRFTLDHIADLTGYADAFALSKAFKRAFGESPESFRRRAPAAGRGA